MQHACHRRHKALGKFSQYILASQPDDAYGSRDLCNPQYAQEAHVPEQALIIRLAFRLASRHDKRFDGLPLVHALAIPSIRQ